MDDDLFVRDGSAESEVRHGESVLKLRSCVPDEALGCLLANGDVTDAEATIVSVAPGETDSRE
jgi:hypothetical protein